MMHDTSTPGPMTPQPSYPLAPPAGDQSPAHQNALPDTPPPAYAPAPAYAPPAYPAATPGYVSNPAPNFDQTTPNYTAPFAPPPPVPNLPPATTGGNPLRPLLIVLSIVGVILLLIVGIGLGRAITAGRASTPNGSPASQIGVGAAPTVSVPASATDLQQTVINVIHTVQPSVVEIQSTGNQGSAIGSGEILTKDGYIVTNDHVVQGYSSYSVQLANGQTLAAQLVGQDAQDDLAVLKINVTNATPISFANSGAVQVGEFAVAIGSPLGLQQSATFGIVSALNRSASEAPSGPAGELTGLIQTSAPINPGNSGGALVDLQGQLIGIPTLGVTDQQTGGVAAGIGFAIPANRVQYVAQQLMANGHLTSTGQGFLGIQGEDVTPQLAAANGLAQQSGVLIVGFANDTQGVSPAQQAGLQTGDIIVGVNGQTVNSSGDLATVLQGSAPGTKVQFTVVRGTQQLTITATLGERPTTGG